MLYQHILECNPCSDIYKSPSREEEMEIHSPPLLTVRLNICPPVANALPLYSMHSLVATQPVKEVKEYIVQCVE